MLIYQDVSSKCTLCLASKNVQAKDTGPIPLSLQIHLCVTIIIPYIQISCTYFKAFLCNPQILRKQVFLRLVNVGVAKNS